VRSAVALEAKKSVSDLKKEDLKGKKILVRCDLNVPFDKETGEISDDTRIRASVPTLKYLLEAGAKVAACSHLGRPKDGYDPKASLAPCAVRMGEYIGSEVQLAPDCVGVSVDKAMKECKEGQLIILENTRFYPQEEKNEAAFVENLAKPFDMYVNDAFGTAHRAHASTEGVTKFLKPSVSFKARKTCSMRVCAEFALPRFSNCTTYARCLTTCLCALCLLGGWLPPC
jgi:phosphoglycerate kinase